MEPDTGVVKLFTTTWRGILRWPRHGEVDVQAFGDLLMRTSGNLIVTYPPGHIPAVNLPSGRLQT